MYELMIEDYFSAAHSLKGYKGNCEKLHGHNWKVQIFIQAKKLDKIGLVLDFRVLKNLLKEVLSTLDHKNLDEIDFFRKYNSSTEKIAEFIFYEIEKRLKKFRNIKLKKVSCWESDKSCASFYK